MNVGITYIPSADLHYSLVEFYSLSTINTFLNIKNCIVFVNYQFSYQDHNIYYAKYVMNQTNTHNNNIIIVGVQIYADSKMPREVISC